MSTTATTTTVDTTTIISVDARRSRCEGACVRVPTDNDTAETPSEKLLCTLPPPRPCGCLRVCMPCEKTRWREALCLGCVGWAPCRARVD